MTIAEIADTVHLAVLGGTLSDDIKVHRSDVLSYIPEAISMATWEDIMGRKDLDRSQFREGVYRHFSGIDAGFLVSYEETLVEDKNYIKLTNRVFSLPANMGINEIHAEGDMNFVRTTRQEKIGLDEVLSLVVPYWFEQYPNEQRIYFQNLPEGMTTFTVRMLASMSSFGQDDLLPVPEYLKPRIINIGLAHFGVQRSQPEDQVADGADNQVRDN